MLCNPQLMKLALWKVDRLQKIATMEKEAIVPAMGADPSAAGGPPPGMGSPGMGGQGGPPPGMPPPGGQPQESGDIATIIHSAIQQAMQQQQMGGAGGQAGGMKPAKPDINTVAMDIFHVKKMLTHLFNSNNIPLPPDLLDGPNRNPTSGEPVPPGTPGSTSDPNKPSQPQPGQDSAIQPIQPMQGAMPAGQPGAEKMSQQMGYVYDDHSDYNVVTRAAALAHLIRQLPK